MIQGPLTAQSVAEVLKVRESSVLSLRDANLSPDNLDFVGLMRAADRDPLVPNAVVMHEGQPFVYLLDYRSINAQSELQLQRGLRLLALRADAPYLAVVRPGVVQVYALTDLDEKQSPVLESDELDPGLLARLIAGVLPARSARESGGAHELMLGLLNAVTDHLTHARMIEPENALALVGRALFMRFLGDRGMIPVSNPLPGVEQLERCFETPAAAATTCHWLDTTFNGDLLELPSEGNRSYFDRLDASPHGSALVDLTAIMRGDTPVGDGAYQTQLKWGDLHFAYVPVGLLSQVYEAFAHRFDSRAAKSQSVYYTPRHLAEYIVDHAFAMLGPKAHQARVLDPASGGGVFLLSVFRRLVKARWIATGVQPTTPVIRQILNQQIAGFDINPAARQLTALALYLTALELDPNAATLQNVKFLPLQGSVLFAAEAFSQSDSYGNLGSLSPAAIKDFEGQFDLVASNPPWTAVRNAKRRAALNGISREQMIARGVEPAANPDGVPDLPFVWAATRWAKPNGVLAFALHGRLLSKVSPAGHLARTRLFQGIDVTYVLNGMELRNTRVWPNMAAPFCFLFAFNRPVLPGSEFHAVTPMVDHSLNREGRIRIDNKDAWSSDMSMVAKAPWLFKALAKGNALDVELLERVSGLRYPTLGDYLADVPSSHGYQTLQKNIPGAEAGFLRKLPDMPRPPDAKWWLVPTAELKPLPDKQVHRRREREIYRAPLALLREAPNSRPGRPMGMLALKDVAYSRSYIGYSCHGRSNGPLLAVYLTALFNSPLFLYFVLLTSSKLGCERSTLQKVEANLFPICPLEELSPRQLAALKDIERAVIGGNRDAEALTRAFVRDVYRLRPADITLIDDRLAIAMPFLATRRRAVAPPNTADVKTFRTALVAGLEPFDMSGTPVQVDVFDQSAMSPWRFLRIGASSGRHKSSATDLLAAIALGDLLDASLVELVQADAMYVGILNQRRFWTRTAARTLALDLVKRGHPVLA